MTKANSIPGLGTLYLDDANTRLLESIALDEGFLSPDDVIMQGLEADDPIATMRGRKRLLSQIVLFDKVDANFSEYNWRKLIEASVVPSSPKMHRVSRHEDTKVIASKNEADVSLYEKCMELTLKIMRQHRLAIARSIRRTLLEEDPLFLERVAHWDKATLLHVYNVLLDSIEATGDVQTGSSRLSDNLLVRMFVIDRFGGMMLGFFWSYADGLFFSSREQASFYSGFVPSGTKPKTHLELLDECLYLARTNFGDSIKVLPSPRNLNEAIEMRVDPAVIGFKEVLNEWLERLSEGRIPALSLLEREIRKANNHLTRLKRIEQFKESYLSFVITTVGHHIPIVSNVLTVVESVGWVYERWAKRRTCWLKSPAAEAS